MSSHIGSAVKRFGHIGAKAAKVAGDVANGVNSIYNKANSYTGGALGDLLRSIPGVGTAMDIGGSALGAFNRVAPHAHQFLDKNVSHAGDTIQNLPQTLENRFGDGAFVSRNGGVQMHY